MSRDVCDGQTECTDGSDERDCGGQSPGRPRPFRSLLGLNATCNPTTQFMCKNGACIPKNATCDGRNDCNDTAASDESRETCPTQPIVCRGAQIKCPNTNLCIMPPDLCDNYDDCGDGADEKRDFCMATPCPAMFVRCKTSQRCIPETWVCDGDKDCGDGSEDEDYPECKTRATCFGEYTFRCNNTRCINRAFVCDGENDCNDGSDEDTRHTCGNRTCAANEFHCASNALLPVPRQECIPKTWVCDGQPNCARGEDEQQNCPKLAECTANEFKCANGQCILLPWKCDGDNDCIDGSDEDVSCPSQTCHKGFTKCASNNRCIPDRWRCDGVNDCQDNPTGAVSSDEVNCDGNTPQGSTLCKADMFDCGDKTPCVNMTQVCDGNKDCLSGADESPQCGINECTARTAGCSQQCTDKPIGFTCSCNEGYRLDKADNRTCRGGQRNSLSNRPIQNTIRARRARVAATKTASTTMAK